MGFFGGGGSAASNMVGATSSAAGTAGLVPAPAAGDNEKFLFGDATFKGNMFVPAFSPLTKSTSRHYSFFLLGGSPTSSSLNLQNTSGAALAPFVINGSATVSQISFVNHTANVNAAPIVGIYQSSQTTGLPLTKIAQANAINLSSTASGVVVTTAITADVKGLFWAFVYSPNAASIGVKAADPSNIGSMFVNSLVGIDTIGALVRASITINNSSISSGTFPTTLSSSDLSSNLSFPPSLFVSY